MLAAHVSAKLQMLSVTTERFFMLKNVHLFGFNFQLGSGKLHGDLRSIERCDSPPPSLHIRLRQVAKRDVNMI